MTPTARSLALLRKAGATAETVEKWLQFPERKNGKPTGRMVRMRQDLFGWCDILAVNPQSKTIHFVQTTTRDNQAARLAKIYESPKALAVIQSGGLVECHGWGMVGARGARKLWECSITHVRAEDCRPIQERAHWGIPRKAIAKVLPTTAPQSDRMTPCELERIDSLPVLQLQPERQILVGDLQLAGKR